MQASLRSRAALVFVLLIVALAFTGWLIWSSSVDKTPSGAILVMTDANSSPSPALQCPYHIIVTRRVSI